MNTCEHAYCEQTSHGRLPTNQVVESHQSGCPKRLAPAQQQWKATF